MGVCWGESCPGGNSSGLELSGLGILQGGNCPGWELAGMGFVLVENCTR